MLRLLARRPLLAAAVALPALLACGLGWSQGQQSGAGPAAPASPQPQPGPTSHLPLTLPGAGPAPAAGPSAPPPAAKAGSPALGEDEYTIKAKTMRIEQGALIAEGDVAVQTHDFDLRGDGAVVDADQIRVQMIGHVEVRGEGMRTRASRFEMNLQTSKWRMTEGRVTLEPAFFGKEAGVAEPLFLRADRLHTPPDQDTIEALGASATTCDRENPHYELRSNHIRVVGNDRVTFEHPSLYVLGTRIIRFPFDLTLSRRSSDNRFIPTVGQDEVEGWYAKFGYLYGTNPHSTGLLHLDFTQKRGTGVGFDHDLETAQQSAKLSLYIQPQEGALTSHLDDTYRFSPHFTSDVTADYQRNSGYYGDSQSLSSNLMLRRSYGTDVTQLGLQDSLAQSGATSSQRFTTDFQHQQHNGAGTDWTFHSTMQDSTFGTGQPSDRSLQTSFEYRNRQAEYDWQIAADKHFDLTHGASPTEAGYSTVNHLPEFTINTDTDRLKSWRPLGRIGVRASLGLGEFEQDPEGLRVSRAAFRFDLGGGEQHLGGHSVLRTSERYYQNFYSDGRAEYVLGGVSELRTDWGGHWMTRLSGSYSNPSGVTPLRLDYWGKDSSMQFQAVRLVPNHSRLELSTGYDFQSSQWNTAVGRYEIMTSPCSKLELDTGYDLQFSQWRPLDLRWVFSHPRQLYIGLGSQYDIQMSQLRQVSMELDWTVTDKWRLEYQTTYSGYTHRLDSMDFRITRDLHCWVGSFSYSKLTGEFQFNLGLKAFPNAQTNFGALRGPMFQPSGGGYY